MTRSAQPSHLVGPLLRYARERGEPIDVAPFGLDASAFERDASALTNLQLGQLFDLVADRLGEPNLGLLLPGQLRFARYALPELAARASADLRQAFQQWARYAPLVHPAIAFEFSENAGRSRLSHRTLGHPRGLSRHLNEFALASSLHYARETSGGGPRVLEVHFVHARPRALDPLHAYFQTTELGFGAEANTLVLDARSLDQPLRTADARLLATVTSFADASLAQRAPLDDSVRSMVVAQLQTQLASGELRLRRLARALHMSVRTLQRRLEAEGTSFAAVLDEVREQQARRLVAQPDASLSEIGHRLGFTEFASFSRAFKRWTGLAPGAFRSAAAVADRS